MSNVHLDVIKQHLIDPEICIRCNTCEETCPVGAITHDSANYVVEPNLCNLCMACVSPCPTGAIDNWRDVAKADAYPIVAQLTWGELPVQEALAEGFTLSDPVVSELPPAILPAAVEPQGIAVDSVRGSIVPPWSAAHPYVNLYTHKNPIQATCVGNFCLTAVASKNDVRHIVLDFGAQPFPVLEGQSVAILPPGTTKEGRAHHARQYSIASPRDGERPGYNNLSLTVKRVVGGEGERDSEEGVCSNYLANLKKGDIVHVLGPYGSSFLMPNHSHSNLLMICTGTGSAPMRAMTEYRRRHSKTAGKLMLFFGARTKEELPYFGPLSKLPNDFIDVNMAFSRIQDEPKKYVQDLLIERTDAVATLLADADTFIYVCGLKGMEDGVVRALSTIANGSGNPWDALSSKMKREGRLHFETY